MRILFISRWFPYPPDNGSKNRVYHLLKSLADSHQVDLISFASEEVTDAQFVEIRRYCRSVEVVQYRPFRTNRWKAMLGFFSDAPRSVIDTHSEKMGRLVEKAVYKRNYNLIIASQIDMISYAVAVPSIPKVLEEIELTVLYERFVKQTHPVKRLRSAMTWWKLSRYVARLMHRFNGCTVASENERALLSQILTVPNICVVPNGVDMRQPLTGRGSPQPNTLIYAGSLTYDANFDAVNYFLREILPQIRTECPSVRLFVTGGLEGVPLERLPNSDSLVFTGYVDDVRPLVASSWASVAPLRIGGGTRVKILESLAVGTPIVATSKGAEGLELTPGRDLLIADTPSDFAHATVRLLRDADLRTTLSQNGRQAVEARYDWTQIGQQFVQFVEAVAAQRQPLAV